MPPDEPNDEEGLEELPEDNGTPFQPADDTDKEVVDPDANEEWPTESEESSMPNSERGNVDDTRPETDSGMIQAEEYDEGVSGAAEASEPNTGDAVIGYNGVGDIDDELDDEVPEGFHEDKPA